MSDGPLGSLPTAIAPVSVPVSFEPLSAPLNVSVTSPLSPPPSCSGTIAEPENRPPFPIAIGAFASDMFLPKLYPLPELQTACHIDVIPTMREPLTLMTSGY